MLFVRLFGLCLFRFVGFLFLLGSGGVRGGGGLRFVIVALPGLFSYFIWDGMRLVIVAFPGHLSYRFSDQH